MNSTRIKIFATALAAGVLILFPQGNTEAAAQSLPPLEISGWIPYWRTATGTADAVAHIAVFKEINPFGYTVKKNGTLYDAMGIDQPAWQALIAAANKHKVRIVPTVMWSDGDAIDRILRDPKSRKAHVKVIVAEVNARGFDGIDIDYEGKKAETKKYFSFFLKELYAAMGKKWVMCTIEPRTPLDSRFDTIPADIAYANDFVALNKYCDRVRIMAYDQGSVDLKLNRSAVGPYRPVADVRWVEKIVGLAAKDIAKKKLVIGVATYGYEYDVTTTITGTSTAYSYDLLWAFNPKYALDVGRQLGVIPARNVAGEMSLWYMPTLAPRVLPMADDSMQASAILGVATGTSTLPHEILTSTSTPSRLLWWSDAQAIKEKVALAKKLGVRGIAIFKIDGGEDPEMWKVLR